MPGTAFSELSNRIFATGIHDIVRQLSMTCSRCASELPEGSRFCHLCGARASGGSAQVVPEAASSAPTESFSQTRSSEIAANTLSPNMRNARFVPGGTIGDRYGIVALIGKGG